MHQIANENCTQFALFIEKDLRSLLKRAALLTELPKLCDLFISPLQK